MFVDFNMYWFIYLFTYFYLYTNTRLGIVHYCDTFMHMYVAGCQYKDHHYMPGEGFYEGCEAYCACTDSGVQCANIQCPTEFGLDVLDPSCLDWETHPPDFKPSPPNCCPGEVGYMHNFSSSSSSSSMSFHPSESHRSFMRARHWILFLLRDFISSQFFPHLPSSVCFAMYSRVFLFFFLLTGFIRGLSLLYFHYLASIYGLSISIFVIINLSRFPFAWFSPIGLAQL
jgi:hypothetical protein